MRRHGTSRTHLSLVSNNVVQRRARNQDERFKDLLQLTTLASQLVRARQELARVIDELSASPLTDDQRDCLELAALMRDTDELQRGLDRLAGAMTAFPLCSGRS